MAKYRIKQGSSRVLSPAEADYDDYRKKIVASQLDLVRRASQRWRDGSGLAGGIAAAAGLLTAPELLKQVDAWQLVDGGWTVGIAIGLAVIALALSLYASIGWPRAVDLESREALERWRASELNLALGCLRASMILTLTAVVITTVAGGVILFGFHLPFGLTFVN